MGTKEEIYQGRVIRLMREDVRLPNGVQTTLELIAHPGASAVVAIADERVTLIRQYRWATSGYLWEIPAGTLDPGEAPSDCASRELLEEVGLSAARWTSLGKVVTAPGFCDEVIHLFLAEVLERHEATPEQDEVIEEVRDVPLEAAMEMIARGDIVDAKTIAGLHLAWGHLFGWRRA